MFNKKFLTVMAVLLSVSFLLTGCGDPADGANGLDGGKGSDGLPPNENFSQSASVEALQDAVENLGAGATLRLDNVTVTGGGVVDFGTSKVRVIGGLVTDADNSGGAAVLNLAAADVAFVGEAKVALGHADDVALLTAAQLAANADTSTGTYAEAVDGEADFENVIGTVTAVKDLTLTSATATYPADLKIYVYGTLTLDSAVAPTFSGSGKVIAIKNVEVAGTTGNVSDSAKVDISLAQISVKDKGTATVKLPATFSGRFSLTGEQEELTVTADTTDITAYMALGNGVLKLAGAVTKAVITGNGRVVFTKSDAPLALTTGSSIATGASGYVSFAGGVSPVAELALDGAVAVGTGKAVTLGTGAVTLAEGSTVYVGAAPAAGSEILTAKGEVALTGDDAVLTVTAASEPANQKLEVGTAALAVAGDVAFGGDLTLTGVGATFGGETLFEPGAKVTLSNGNSVVTLSKAAVLGIPVEGSPAWGYILHNTDETNAVTLTPESDGAVFTFAAGRTLTQGAKGSTGHSITVAGTGKATLVAGAAYVVESEAGKVGTLTVANTVTLTLAAGVLGGDSFDDNSAKLVLTGVSGTDGAVLAGQGLVVLGNASISSGATGGWRAVGADTTIVLSHALATAAEITGTGTGAQLAGFTADGAITLAKGNTDGDGAALTVANATIDLSAFGTVVFPYVATTAATLVLQGGSGPGALKVNSGTTGNTNLNLKDGSHSVLISGDSIVVQGASNEAQAAAGLVSGGAASPANDATITGQLSDNAVTVKKGATLESSAT